MLSFLLNNIKNNNKIKLIYISIFTILFIKIFIVDWRNNWVDKYTYFGVVANTYPGGDARNIQLAAHCARYGFKYLEKSNCYEEASTAKNLYPDAHVPNLNYPSIWPRFYGLFGDSSENFFQTFWTINALFCVLCIACLAYRKNFLLFPLLVFNPVTLLLVERGNVDGITFACVFLPILYFNSQSLYGFFMGLATALKIFPFLGVTAFIRPSPPYLFRPFLIGLLFAAPLIALAIYELPILMQETPMGFSNAYGLLSIKYYEGFDKQSQIPTLFIICFLILIFLCIKYALNSKMTGEGFKRNIQTKLSNKERLLTTISIIIYLGTFFLFINWAYRLVFLIPSALFLFSQRSILSKIISYLILILLWIPVVPFGWYFQNLVCYLIAPLIVTYLIFLIKSNLKKYTELT